MVADTPKEVIMLRLSWLLTVALVACAPNTSSVGQHITCQTDPTTGTVTSCEPGDSGGANTCQDIDEDGDGDAHDEAEDADDDDAAEHASVTGTNDDDEDDDGIADADDADDDNDGISDDHDCDEHDGEDGADN
jgi:hypothetical protein